MGIAIIPPLLAYCDGCMKACTQSAYYNVNNKRSVLCLLLLLSVLGLGKAVVTQLSSFNSDSAVKKGHFSFMTPSMPGARSECPVKSY